MNGYERILAKFQARATDSLPYMPITMMFAATHSGVLYGQYVRDHRILVAGQIHVAKTFDFDYVSCISDPGREAADCGAEVLFYEDQPPAIDEEKALLREKSRLDSLQIPDPLQNGSRMQDRVQAAALFKERVKGEKWIEGWVEGPCAEGADLRGINRLMLDFTDDPEFVHRLFEFTTRMGISFAKAQIEAGCDMIGIGDAAASLVGPRIYRDFVLPYEMRLVRAIRDHGARVRLHICGNTSRSLREIGTLGCEQVDLDYMVPVAKAREEMGPEQVLTSNIDPVKVLRNGTPELVSSTLQRCFEEAGRANMIVGAGCEVPRDTPLDNLDAMREFARSR